MDFPEYGHVHAALKLSFRDVDVVQFASIALLPARAEGG